MNVLKEELTTLEKLGYETLNLWDNIDRLAEFGEVNDILVGAMKAQIRLLYKSTIAKICGIEEENVTDEYIEIAMQTLPTGGYDAESGTLWDGFRFITDGELINLLKPLIERDTANRQKMDELLEQAQEIEENDEDVIEELNDQEVLEEVSEETKPYIMGDLHNKLNSIVEHYNTDALSDEEKKSLVNEYNALARHTIANIMKVEAETLPDGLISFILQGKTVEYKEDDKLVMIKVPYSDEEVKDMAQAIPMFIETEKSIDDMIQEYQVSFDERHPVSQEQQYTMQ